MRYIYFIDEIFLPNQPLLEALVARDVVFGVQTRIDLWKPELIDLLGTAGCVSIEAGVESLSPEGREQLAKRCRLSTEELVERLIRARSKVPFVQANLIAMASDEADAVARWRALMQRHGVWANDPVPLYPYPSSPDYHQLFGAPDDLAWERAHAHYLGPVQPLQRHSGRAAAASGGFGGAMPVIGAVRPLRRVFMTADAVGGVWTYALELARGLPNAGSQPTWRCSGPSPSAPRWPKPRRSRAWS